MQLKNSVVSAALLASSAFASSYTPDYKLNAYWGQAGPSTDTLGAHCESDSIDYVTLAFVNNSPENGNGTNYPGTNFAAHCAADVYVKNGRNSKLLSGCSFIKDDIQTCQKLGKKVLLSIGGEYTATSNYTLTSNQNGLDFAEFLYKSFGPYKQGYTGPRPFDPSSTSHTCLDGFDFDIETKFDNQEPYVHMVNHLRELISADKKDMILTAAPQCPQSDAYFQMKTILTEAQFDKIWIQFYNNPSCDAVTRATFNYDLWEDFISGGINDAAELFIGLPGSISASGSGYITHDAAKNLICSYKNKAHFGGAMVWDAYYASTNKDLAGQAYHEALSEALKCGGCDGDVCAPAASTSSSVSTSTLTSSTSSSTTSTVTTTSTSSAATSTITSSATSSTASETCTDSTSSSTSSAATSSTVTSSAVTSSVVTSSTVTSSSATSSETCTDSSTSSAASSSTASSSTASSYIATSSSSESASSTSTDSTTSSALVTSTSSAAVSTTTSSYSASSSTSSEEDDCEPDDLTSSSYVESATVSVSATTTGSVSASETVTSSSYPTATTTASVSASSSSSSSSSESGYPSSSLTASVSSSSSEGIYPSSSITASSATTLGYTTSTVMTTKVYTVTSCAPSVTNCPARGAVVTETIPLYTTVCPITEVGTQKLKPTTTEATAVPVTTSTIYSTRVATITKCPAWVTNCPANSISVSTTVIPVSTTVYSVSEVKTTPITTSTPAVATSVVTSPVYSTKVGSATTETVTIGLTTYPAGSGSETTPATTAATSAVTYPAGSGSATTPAASAATSVATYPAGSASASESKPVSAAAVSSYPAGNAPGSSSSVYVPTTIQTVAVPVYPTGSASNSTVPAYSSAAASTGYPVKPTTTAPAGSTSIVCNGEGCSAASSAAYPTASVVTAGAAKTATFGVAGLLAVAAALAL